MKLNLEEHPLLAVRREMSAVGKGELMKMMPTLQAQRRQTDEKETAGTREIVPRVERPGTSPEMVMTA